MSDMLQLVVSCEGDFCGLNVRYASACRFLRRRLLRVKCTICFSLSFSAKETSAAYLFYILHQLVVSCEGDFCGLNVRYASACRFLRRRLLRVECPICFSLSFPAKETSAG